MRKGYMNWAVGSSLRKSDVVRVSGFEFPTRGGNHASAYGERLLASSNPGFWKDFRLSSI
jgi:hypothetical protein